MEGVMETTTEQAQTERRRTQHHAGPPIVVRKMGFDFSGVPRRWFAGLATPSHVINGLSLLFPEGERFFIRAVKNYQAEIRDPALKERVRAFFGQEARHGLEHEATFEMLERQGFEIRSFLAWYEKWAYAWLEPKTPRSLRLSVTVALEHFTASLAEFALDDPFLDRADPTMRALLRWHACEEIEHKAVAFDVFEDVDGRYWVRIAGLVVGTAALLGFWQAGTRMLLRQEHLEAEDRNAERKAAGHVGRQWGVIRRAFLQYLKPGFHPDQIDNYPAARAYLERIGRLTA